MALLRVLSHRSCTISSVCPSVAQRLSRQLQRKCVSSRSCGSSGSRSFLVGSSGNLKARQWKSLGVERQRMAASRSTFCVSASAWKADQTPYETLGVTRDAEEDEIKSSYRQMAKQFHPDVYNDNTGGLLDGETSEGRFIRIQAAYELLMDKDQRRQYDLDHRIHPLQASKVWMDWVLKKKKAFDRRGDMAASVWAEQQQREMNLKARQKAKHKMDPEEERRILAKEKMASTKNFETTLSRHTLVLKKRELLRRKEAEEAKRKLVQQLLAAEGLELDEER